LLERRVPLESLPAVEQVAPIESFANAREKEVNRMKITESVQSIPAVSANKSV
jgi:hypothetical protein